MQEFLDFLATQPPFDALDTEDLGRLAERLKVAYFAAGTLIVAEDEVALQHMWVIRTGQVEVLDRGQVVDLLGVGDTFGHISVLTGLRPALAVRALKDTVCYQLPDPRTVLRHPEALQFSHFGTLISRRRLTGPGLLGSGQNSVSRYLRPVLWCDPGDTVRTAADRMTAVDASSVLVAQRGGIGIATDRDFRSEVAGGRVSVDAPITEVTSTPVETVHRTTTVAAALLRMVEAGVHHLAVSDDGGAVVGVVRAIDLGSTDVRDPLLIRTAISAATDLAGLAEAAALIGPTLVELHDNDVPALRVADLLTAVTEAVLRRLLDLSSDPGGEVVDTSWMVLGSMARREPLPASDVDTAVLWATGDGHSDSDSASDSNQAGRIRGHATTVLDRMEKCGLRRCPNGANADNPLFSRSRSSWMDSARRWVGDPTAEGALLLSSVIADSRPITRPALGRAITDTLASTTQSLEFREALLRFATASRPPVGFVRDFVIEHSGEHRGGFDLKRGGLLPVTALARWLAIVMGDVRGGTVDRIQRAVGVGLLTTGEADTLVRAFGDVYDLVFAREITALRNGRATSTWVTPGDLDPLARRHLRESFRAVSTIQTTVVNTWQQRLRP